MTADRRAARWLVSGRVQGVGYRWFVLRQAERLGITAGSARNLPDGRVEVLAAAEPQILDELEAALREGPRFARVENVERSEISLDVVPSKQFTIK